MNPLFSLLFAQECRLHCAKLTGCSLPFSVNIGTIRTEVKVYCPCRLTAWYPDGRVYDMKKRLTALFAALLLALPFPAAAIGAEDDTAGSELGETIESSAVSDSQPSVEDETESVQESPVVLSPHWEQRGGQFVLLDGTGEPMSGWVQLDGKWYLLSENGIRQMAGGKWMENGTIWMPTA